MVDLKQKRGKQMLMTAQENVYYANDLFNTLFIYNRIDVHSLDLKAQKQKEKENTKGNRQGRSFSTQTPSRTEQRYDRQRFSHLFRSFMFSISAAYVSLLFFSFFLLANYSVISLCRKPKGRSRKGWRRRGEGWGRGDGNSKNSEEQYRLLFSFWR
jgi:hypothetical protein